jgi:Tol biopolymer transport system component
MTRRLMVALAGALVVTAVAGHTVTLDAGGFERRMPHAPTLFAPGVISGPAHDSAPAFTPGGDEVYFTRSNAEQSTIFVSRRVHGHWREATIAPFSGEWNDMEPAFAPDGSYLVFVSNRPTTDGAGPLEGHFNGASQKGGNLWRVDRRGDDWDVPKRLPDAVNPNASTYAPSVAGDGSLWFMTTDEKSGRFRLFRAQYRDGHYLAAVSLPFSDGSSTDVDPAVAPDESFVVFGSGRTPKRGIDLFIAYRDGPGWSAPRSLDDINGAGSDAEARLSPDLETLYFSSDRVEPVAFPRSRRQPEQDSARMQAWDNGNYNIWEVPLAPLRVAHPPTGD